MRDTQSRLTCAASLSTNQRNNEEAARAHHATKPSRCLTAPKKLSGMTTRSGAVA